MTEGGIDSIAQKLADLEAALAVGTRRPQLAHALVDPGAPTDERDRLSPSDILRALGRLCGSDRAVGHFENQLTVTSALEKLVENLKDARNGARVGILDRLAQDDCGIDRVVQTGTGGVVGYPNQ